MSGKDVLEFRKRLKLSRNKFGKLIGYTDNMIYRVETGRNKISEKLEISINLLLRSENEKHLPHGLDCPTEDPKANT